jgi:hypothetical protein
MACGVRQTYVTQDTLTLGQLGDGSTRAVYLWPRREGRPVSSAAFGRRVLDLCQQRTLLTVHPTKLPL